MSESLTDALVQIIKRQKALGARGVTLSSEVADSFFAPVKPPSAPPPSQAASAPSAPPRPRVSLVSSLEEEPPPVAAGPPAFQPQALTGPPVGTLDWEALRACAESCRQCPLCQERNKLVFGAGARDARLMFIGEGPGQEEDRQGIPFVGPAGQLLTKMIAAMQFDRSQVYIGNIVKCRPPRNRNPEPREAEACRAFLDRQIELIKPEVIVLLGAVPLLFLLGVKGIMRSRGQWFDYKGIPVMPTFHPSFLLRVPQQKRPAWEDLQKVMARLAENRQG